jgi:hypothetical protein
VKLIVERVVGLGEYEPVGEAEVSGPKGVVAEALEALGVTETGDYRAYPAGLEQDAGFWRLRLDGTVEQIDVPST